MGTVVYLRQHGIRHSEEPISNMNMTPLIDVLLVLLVMLILTVPIALHKVDVDLPVAGPATRESVQQKLMLSADGLAYWNGRAVTNAQLIEELKVAAANKDDLQFQSEANARYERFDQLIAEVKRAGITKIGFVGNNAFSDFGKMPVIPTS
jgi:biopolymer transport protein ExbD